MPSVNILIESPVSQSTRSQQLQAIFDVPAIEKARLTLAGEFPYDDADWNVGLIVGPSGCGKSTILREVFGDQTQLEWGAAGVIDDFRQDISIQEISEVCQAVGFNTIPAWVRPYAVLSNGEKFRVDLARRLIESSATIVVDEFTSVVDRQVAQIGAHAVQKYARRRNLKFVAASCHYDIIDWLQPDWMLEPATMTFTRRSLRRRPEVECQLARVPYDTWRIFAPFHYLTSDLHRAARCFALSVNGRIAAFAGMLHRPHPHLKGGTLWGCSRLVTLPDFQGLGLAFVLIDRIGAMYAALGKRIRTYPAHPALIRAFDHSKLWALKIKPGYHMSPRHHAMSGWRPGARPCAVFEYCGPAHEDRAEAELVIG